MTYPKLNLDEVYDDLVELAIEACDMVRTATPSITTADTKSNTADLVTVTDKAIEAMIIARLKDKYPAVL
jgi:myo-inositol-1(or 4)-monophosphatase